MLRIEAEDLVSLAGGQKLCPFYVLDRSSDDAGIRGHVRPKHQAVFKAASHQISQRAPPGVGSRSTAASGGEIDVDLWEHVQQSDHFLEKRVARVHHPETQLRIPHQNIFQEERIAEAHAVRRPPPEGDSGLGQPHVEADRKVSRLRPPEDGVEGGITGRHADVLRGEFADKAEPAAAESGIERVRRKAEQLGLTDETTQQLHASRVRQSNQLGNILLPPSAGHGHYHPVLAKRGDDRRESGKSDMDMGVDDPPRCLTRNGSHAYRKRCSYH